MTLLKESGSQWLRLPVLIVVCGLVMWPADQANARKIFNVIQGPTENQCRVCHQDLDTFPQLKTSNPNRHHQLVNKPISGLGGGSHPTRAPGDTSYGIYLCLTCHEVDESSQISFDFKPFRDCLTCHIKSSVTTSPGSEQNVHHFTKTYYQDRCKECHESPLANLNNNLSDKVAGDFDYSSLLKPPASDPGGDPGSSTAIAIDNVSSGATRDSTRLAISHTTTGTNRLMLVGVAIEDNANRYVTSMTYNGQAMIRVGIKEINNKAHTEIWRLVAPPTGAGNVVMNFNGPVEKGAVAGVMTFTGVNQSAPLGAFASASGSNTQPKVTVSATPGDLVFATGMHWGNPLGNPGAGQTEHWERASDKTNGAGSTTVATSTSVTMSWSNTDADWALAGVAIKPN